MVKSVLLLLPAHATMRFAWLFTSAWLLVHHVEAEFFKYAGTTSSFLLSLIPFALQARVKSSNQLIGS